MMSGLKLRIPSTRQSGSTDKTRSYEHSHRRIYYLTGKINLLAGDPLSIQLNPARSYHVGEIYRVI